MPWIWIQECMVKIRKLSSNTVNARISAQLAISALLQISASPQAQNL